MEKLNRKRIREEANRKRAEAMQGVPYAPKGEIRKPVEEKKVVPQSVGTPSLKPTDKNKTNQAKAAASKTNTAYPRKL